MSLRPVSVCYRLSHQKCKFDIEYSEACISNGESSCTAHLASATFSSQSSAKWNWNRRQWYSDADVRQKLLYDGDNFTVEKNGGKVHFVHL